MDTGNNGELNLSKYKVMSIAVEVEDLDKAVEYYSSNFGMGPWVIHERVNDCVLHGREKSHTARWAVTPLGGGQLVLNLCQIIEGESIHKELLRARGEGISSFCIGVPDLNAEIAKLEKRGIAVAQYCKKKTGGAYAYIEPGKIGGLTIELLEGEIWGIPPEWTKK